MKKTLLGLMAATAIISLAKQTSAAENYEFTKYVGADYVYTNGVATQARPNYNSAAINFGTDYNRFFGTELFYQYSDETKTGYNTDKVKSSFQAGGLDIYGYLPVTCDNEFALLATTGFGIYDFKFKHADPLLKENNDSGYGYRAGVGAMYRFNNNWSARAIARYVGIDKVEDIDHLMEYSAGVRYNF